MLSFFCQLLPDETRLTWCWYRLLSQSKIRSKISKTFLAQLDALMLSSDTEKNIVQNQIDSLHKIKR